MRLLFTALTAPFCVLLLAAPALAQSEAEGATGAEVEEFVVEGAFSVELPAGGSLVLDEDATDADALVYAWTPQEGRIPVALIQVRVDELGEEVYDELFSTFVFGMLDAWEAEPESYTVLGAEDGLHYGNYAWTALDIEHKNVEPIVYHTSLSMAQGERIYSLIFYYLEPGEVAGGVMSQVLAGFTAMAPDEVAAE